MVEVTELRIQLVRITAGHRHKPLHLVDQTAGPIHQSIAGVIFQPENGILFAKRTEVAHHQHPGLACRGLALPNEIEQCVRLKSALKVIASLPVSLVRVQPGFAAGTGSRSEMIDDENELCPV